MHKRLAMEESYKEKDYETALKKAFLGIDEDLQASAWYSSIASHIWADYLGQDPAHTKDPSGCTAVAALITDKKIYVVRSRFLGFLSK